MKLFHVFSHFAMGSAVLGLLGVIGCGSSQTPHAAGKPANDMIAPKPVSPSSVQFGEGDGQLPTRSDVDVVRRRIEADAKAFEPIPPDRAGPKAVSPTPIDPGPPELGAGLRPDGAVMARPHDMQRRSGKPPSAHAPAMTPKSDGDVSAPAANEPLPLELAKPNLAEPDHGAGKPSTQPSGDERGMGSAAAPVIPSLMTDADSLSRKVTQRAKDAPQDRTAQLDYELLRFLKGDGTSPADPANSLPQEDRDLIGTFLDGLANFRTVLRDDGNGLISRKVRPLLEMADRLHSQAQLAVPTFALCSKVTGFGVYDPMSNYYRAGTDHWAIAYCEVENFASQPDAKQMWQTRLSLEVVLFTLDGAAIWSDKSSVPVDVTRSRRHDFFVIKRMLLPKTLALGRYILKVTVVDEQTQQMAENNLEITMGVK